MNSFEDLDNKYLGTISQDFVQIADIIKESSYQIRKSGFLFPVFPICREEQPIGKLLIEKQYRNLDWNYYASFLDEFIKLKLISKDKEPEFKNAFKDPDEFCCLFVLDKKFNGFMFIPYPID